MEGQLDGPGSEAPSEPLTAVNSWREHRGAGVLIAAAAAGIVALVVAINLAHSTPKAAASAAASTTSTSSSSTSMPGMPGMGTTKTTTGLATIKQATLPVMQTSGAMPTAMAMVPVGQANWDGMTIAARTSAPATFIVPNGTSEQTVRPTAKTSFHLMVLLSDEYTQVSIPYSSVWATISKNGKVVYDERLWPMISRYMGPHYGNNVNLPSSGLYQLTLLVSPPAAARHIEYDHLWPTAHRVSFMFRWIPKA